MWEHIEQCVRPTSKSCKTRCTIYSLLISNVPAVLWELVIQNYWFAVLGDPLSNGSHLGTLQRCNADPVFVCSLIASGLGTSLRPEIIFIFTKMRWCHHELFRSYNYLRVVSLEQFQSSYSITAMVRSSCWHMVLICARASCHCCVP